jgi:hypothetical protein
MKKSDSPKEGKFHVSQGNPDGRGFIQERLELVFEHGIGYTSGLYSQGQRGPDHKMQ